MDGDSGNTSNTCHNIFSEYCGQASYIICELSLAFVPGCWLSFDGCVLPLFVSRHFFTYSKLYNDLVWIVRLTRALASSSNEKFHTA